MTIGGTYGKTLHVDLTTGEHQVEHPPEDFYRLPAGGRWGQAFKRAAGRNGLGALLGSKNLKAVAVRGTIRLPVAERNEVTPVAKWFGQNYEKLVAWATAGIGRGRQDSLMNWGYLGGLPTHNFAEPIFEERELLSGERNDEMFLEEGDTRHSCPITCKQVFEHEAENPYQKLNPEYGGPEYEAMAALGPNCDVSDNLAVSKASEL